MTYTLIIGDRTFSSWSLRGWLLFDRFNIPVKTKVAGLYSDHFAQDLEPYAPARLVPIVETPEGVVIGETLAIAETLAERHPESGMWPADPAARAFARWIVSEMHAGFTDLRNECPMQLMHQYQDFTPSDRCLSDLRRLETLWAKARETWGQDGPWLFGEYSIADAFFAPVAARIAGYDLAVNDQARAYVATHLAEGSFRRWRAMGATYTYDPVPYAKDLPHRAWPGPAPIAATAIEEGTPENQKCPYSQDPVTHLLEIDGRIFGFCNAFCRDKTLQDPAAWPKFMEIYRS